MSLSDLTFSAVGIFFGFIFVVTGVSYLAYKVKNKRPYDFHSN